MRTKFTGHDTTHVCKIKGAHAPHVRSWYTTQNYGRLQNFCTGRSGILNDGTKMSIRFVAKQTGDAYSPGYAVVEVEDTEKELR